MTDPAPLVSARGLVKEYRSGTAGIRRRAGAVRALDEVDLEVRSGETLGLVGESGSGKSTLGRVLLHLERPNQGEVTIDGRRPAALSGRELRAIRHDMQPIFQDPASSLNPRWSVGQIVAEGLRARGVGRVEQRRLVADILDAVGLRAEVSRQRPRELSGGQRQRVGIARALVLRPRFVVADEAVSALDVSVQAQVLNLLAALKVEFALTYLFISHNLAVVGYISDRIAVMYLGRIVEVGDAEQILAEPLHPYTRALLTAIPGQGGDRRGAERIAGDIPAGGAVSTAGCTFRDRCPLAMPVCAVERPALTDRAPGRQVACHAVGEQD